MSSNPTEEDIKSILQIEVPSFSEKYVNNKSETFYLIIVKNLFNKKKWSLEKTYKDFENLNSELYKLLPNVPSFSSFQLFKSSRAYNTIVERKTEIFEYLNECVGRKDVLSNKTFASFLEIDKNFPDLLYNSPETISSFEDTAMSITDFIFLQKSSILFTISSMLNFTGRVDSYIKSADFLKWGKAETSVDLSENEVNKDDADKGKIGAFYAFRLTEFKNKSGELKIKLDKLFAKYFDDMTSALYYDESAYIFIVGFSSGKSIFYKIMPESDFTQFDLMTEVKYHNDKCTGIACDSNTGLFYSCGCDKKFYVGVINMIYGNTYVPELVREGNGEYLRLFLDSPNDRLYLSTSQGHLEVFQTSTKTPTFIKDVASSQNLPINDIFCTRGKNLLFGCSDGGFVHVFDLGKPGQEKTTKEISYFDYFETKVKLKSILWEKERNFVVTGDVGGRVFFWDLRKGLPFMVMKISAKAVIRMRWVENTEEENKLILITCADHSFYFLRLPLKWLDNEEIEDFEKIEIKNISDLNAMIKIQNFLAQDEDYNSDEDSLNGWDYFANDIKEEADRQKAKKKK